MTIAIQEQLRRLEEQDVRFVVADKSLWVNRSQHQLPPDFAQWVIDNELQIIETLKSKVANED